MVSVSGYLIGSQEAGKMPLPPKAELQWWYQFYFATERGRAGYDKYRHDFAKLIWQLASPKWNFDDATFDRSAAAFDNPDHVAIVIHNYRWRLGLAEGEPKYDDLEKRLAAGPGHHRAHDHLEGDANGAPHPEPSAYAKKFSGKYAHRTHHGRHRAQSAAGSAAGLCPGGRRYRQSRPLRVQVIKTHLSDLRDYLREYWGHASQSFGRKAFMACLWFARDVCPLGLKTIVDVPQWAAVTWMISWAAVGYLFAPFGLWKTQRKKITELQGRAQQSRNRK